jgi:hypothetical protein
MTQMYTEAGTSRAIQHSAASFIRDVHPDTLLSVTETSPLLHCSHYTLQANVKLRPQIIPIITRIGRRVFFKKSDIDAFINAGRQELPTPPAPPAEPRKPGRPTKASISAAKLQAASTTAQPQASGKGGATC